MTQEEIFRIEETLKIKLPEFYKLVVINNPLSPEKISERLNINIPRAYDKSVFEKGSYEDRMMNLFCSALYDDPDKIIELNNRLRKRGLKGKHWENLHFAIGYKFRTTYYFINLNTNDNYVYITDNTKGLSYNPENIKNNAVYPDIKSFLSTPLTVLEGEERKRKGLPKPPSVNVNEFLMKMNEEISKQQKKDT